MKLTDTSYSRTILKGTIILFLFLHFSFLNFAQKYTLKIITNQSELPKPLKKKMYRRSFSDSTLIYLQLNKIKSQLFSEGYISASFDSIKFDSALVSAYLFTGKKYTIDELYVKNIYPSLKRKFHLTDSGKIAKRNFNPVNLPALYENIITEYENTGCPFASLVPEKIEIKDSAIRLNLQLQKNNLIRINKLIIKGNAHISAAFVSRYLSLFEGNLYNEARINSIGKKIKISGFLSEIRPAEVDFFNHKADVYLYLKTKKANLFNGVIGFLPDKENDNKLSFTGNLDLNLLNNFGKGESVFLRWSRTAKLSQKLDVGFALPYVFKSPFSLRSQFNLDKRDTSFMKISGKFGIDYSLKNNNRITAFVRKKQSLLLSAQTLDTSIFKNTNVLLFGFSYRSEKYDYKFNPLKGYYFNAEFAGGNRIVSSLQNAYYEVDMKTDYYLPLEGRWVVKFSTDTKYAFPDAGFYENELFDLGGFNSLKGFDENRFRTSAYSVLTLEQRYLYERNSNVFAFFNIAGFKDFSDFEKIKTAYGFGIGTNLSTKAGIFSISYALGTMPGQFLQFSDSKIHLGYVNRF